MEPTHFATDHGVWEDSGGLVRRTKRSPTGINVHTDQWWTFDRNELRFLVPRTLDATVAQARNVVAATTVLLQHDVMVESNGYLARHVSGGSLDF